MADLLDDPDSTASANELAELARGRAAEQPEAEGPLSPSARWPKPSDVHDVFEQVI